MYRYVSYYKPYFEREYIFHESIYPLDCASLNESVFMVPGSVWQMQQDIAEEDYLERREGLVWDMRK